MQPGRPPRLPVQDGKVASVAIAELSKPEERPAQGEHHTMPAELVIKDLRVNVDDKPILTGVDLTIRQGEVHALMGPNGSGKSTLAYTIAGHPRYQVVGGDILLNGNSILKMTAD